MKNKAEKQKSPGKKCSIGGQAVLEGVMMKSPQGIAMAVRRADGTIATSFKAEKTKAQKGTFYGLPIVRGVVSFIESLVIGTKTITESANMYGEDMVEEEPNRFEKWLAEKTGQSTEKVVVGVAVFLAVILAVGLFFILPTFISSLILKDSTAAGIWKSLIEGAVRLLVFFVYIVAISGMKDVKRLFMYHGAEHKTIACYEHDASLTPENARNFSRFHPRCGTNYLFLVMAISILFFAAIGWNANFGIRLLTRIIFVPLVAGISYEVLRLAAKSDNLIARIVRAPGLAIQRLTTKEPDDDMLEVAITAFQYAMDPETFLAEQQKQECQQADDATAEQLSEDINQAPAVQQDGEP